jgi:hypothetical protein
LEPGENARAPTDAASPTSVAERREALARSLLLWLAGDPLAAPGGWVLSWINPEHPGYPYEETSAYALRLLVTCPWRNEAPLRARAEQLATAIADALLARGALGRDGIAYVFDTAMGVAALAAARRAGMAVEREPIARGAAFVNTGLRLGRAAARRGEWFTGDRWSTQLQPHLLKCVIALEEAAGAGVAVAGAVDTHALAEDFAARQLADGAFPLRGETFVDVHVHSYALEGLAFLGRSSGRYSRLLRRGVEWLARVQAANGGIPRHVGPHTPARCMADVTAQAARLFLLADPVAWRPQAEHCLRYLDRLRVPGAGLRYAADADDVNTWSTIFAVQALLFASGDPDLDALT